MDPVINAIRRLAFERGLSPEIEHCISFFVYNWCDVDGL